MFAVRNFYRSIPKLVTEVLYSYNFLKLGSNLRKFSYFLVNLKNNFLIFNSKVFHVDTRNSNVSLEVVRYRAPFFERSYRVFFC